RRWPRWTRSSRRRWPRWTRSSRRRRTCSPLARRRGGSRRNRGAAVGVYFLWPAGVAVGATMKAPGAIGFVISRAAFLANPQLYFQILRTAGAAAAAAAFAL
uniref:Uncharacterized protein n=2 Tax=Aegilops tauschii subsp. strangulata TaxID=200361 RepID=A0A453B4Z0_AEGTS